MKHGKSFIHSIGNDPSIELAKGTRKVLKSHTCEWKYPKKSCWTKATNAVNRKYTSFK